MTFYHAQAGPPHDRPWRREKWRALFPEEGVVIEPSLRLHFWGALLRTGPYVRWLRGRFRRWSVQPGDVFYEIVTDRYHRVDEVRHDYVIAEPISGQMLHYVERGQVHIDDPGLIRISERVERPLPESWWPSDKVLPL